MNGIGRWAVGIEFAVAAWAVITVAPDHREHTADPIPVPVAVGQTVDISGLSVTVTDIHVTDGLAPPTSSVLSGLWVVVDLDVMARDSDFGAPLGPATLLLGDTVITSSDLVYWDARIDGMSLHTGLVLSGSTVFQLPPDAQLGEATVLLERRADDARGVWSDDQAQLDLDLSAIPQESELALDRPTVAAP